MKHLNHNASTLIKADVAKQQYLLDSCRLSDLNILK